MRPYTLKLIHKLHKILNTDGWCLSSWRGQRIFLQAHQQELLCLLSQDVLHEGSVWGHIVYRHQKKKMMVYLVYLPQFILNRSETVFADFHRYLIQRRGEYGVLKTSAGDSALKYCLSFPLGLTCLDQMIKGFRVDQNVDESEPYLYCQTDADIIPFPARAQRAHLLRREA